MRHSVLAFACYLAGLCCVSTLYAQTADSEPGTEPWQNRVDQAMAHEDWREAIRVLDSVIEDMPGSLEARFRRAIAYREKARETYYHTPNAVILDAADLRRIWKAAQSDAAGESWELELPVDHDVSKAIFDFEYVLERDSSFRYALYEYAQLWHTHHVLDRAIEVGEAQIRRHPHMPEGHEELVASYRHFLAWAGSERALRRLQSWKTPYASYISGEVHRREERYEDAERVYTSLLESRADVPRQLVLLSMARVRIAQGRFEDASAFIEQALDFDSLVGARLLLDVFWYVLDDAEHAESQSLSSVDEYASFFERIWERRNPTPASPINWRLVEHFRRLTLAEREFEFFGSRKRPMGDIVDSEDIVPAYDMDIDVPPWYYDVHGFNDKGLIYIRYGDPDEKLWTQPRSALPPDPGVPPNESWRYLSEGLDFHFVNPYFDGEAFAWFLVASLGDCYMAADRSQWGGAYLQLAPRMRAVDPRKALGPNDPCGSAGGARNPFDATAAFSKLSDAGRAAVDTGLATDRHTWSTITVEPFEFPLDIVTFRGDGGRTDVSMYFALPVGRFSEELSEPILPVEVGFALHDVSWQSITREAAVRRYPRSEDATKAAFEEIHLSVLPDSYRVSIHADLLGTPPLGGYQLARAIPDYTRPETMMSDLVLAYDIRPKQGHAPTTRSSLQITANPFHRAALDQPLHVYFELYNLALDPDDRARYRVRFTLEPTEKEGGVLGLFGRRQPGLSVSASFEDATPSPIVFSQVDVSELPEGEYEFVVHVTDESSGHELQRRMRIALYERAP